MKKISKFWWMILTLSILFIIFVALNVGTTSTYLIGIIFLSIEAKRAYIPPKAFNPMKSWCHRKGTPHIYRRICIVWVAVFVVFGLIDLIEQIVKWII